MKKTIIYLHSLEPAIISAIMLDDHGGMISSWIQTPLTALSLTPACEVTLIIPADYCRQTTLSLPKMSRKKSQQALLFAMEESLLEDIDNIHLAVGEFDSQTGWPLVIIEKNKIKTILSLFAAHQIYPHQLIPLTFALPLIQDHLTLLYSEPYCYGRISCYEGFTAETDQLSFYLQDKNKQNLNVHEIKKWDESVLHSLYETIQSHAYINLLQGPFQPKQMGLTYQRWWRYTVTFAGGALLLKLMSVLLSILIFHHRDQQLQQDIARIYYHHFPRTVTSNENPMKTVTSQAMKATSFLSTLSHLAPIFSTQTTLRLERLDFRDNQFTLGVSTTQVASLNQFTHQLKQIGLNAVQQTVENTDNQVTAIYHIGHP